MGAQIKILVRDAPRISRESRVVSVLSYCSLGEWKVPGFCGWQALLFRITIKSSAFEGSHAVLSYDTSYAHSPAGTSSSSLPRGSLSASSCGCVLAPISFPQHGDLCLPLPAVLLLGFAGPHCPALTSPLRTYLLWGSWELIPPSATHLETFQHKPQQGRNRSACCFPGIGQKAGHLISHFPSFLVQMREQV